jgi:hypothetical protein
MTDSLTKVLIDNLELQKSVLIQELNSYRFTNQDQAAVETKQQLDEIVERIRKLKKGERS